MEKRRREMCGLNLLLKLSININCCFNLLNLIKSYNNNNNNDKYGFDD
jgi:hypothetical protein